MTQGIMNYRDVENTNLTSKPGNTENTEEKENTESSMDRQGNCSLYLHFQSLSIYLSVFS